MRGLIRFVLWMAILVGGAIALLRVTVLRWWRIPIDDPVLVASIAPTLRGGDLVLLWRATSPRFGSLVLCPDPDEPSDWVIGRIVGEPGDTVAIQGADVYVNDDRMDTEYACADAKFTVIDPITGNEVEQSCDIEAMGQTSHPRGSAAPTSFTEQRTTREVGEDRFFLISDNRRFPYDSRHYGTVDVASCKESIFFRLVSARGFKDVKNRLTYIR